jgi:hypothetical protein
VFIESVSNEGIREMDFEFPVLGRLTINSDGCEAKFVAFVLHGFVRCRANCVLVGVLGCSKHSMPSSFNPETQSSKNLLAGRLLERVASSYPLEALQQWIEGTVQLHAMIGDDGKVLSLEPVSGPPLLIEAALIAVRQWRYGPTLFDGHRVQVLHDVRLVFWFPD